MGLSFRRAFSPMPWKSSLSDEYNTTKRVCSRLSSHWRRSIANTPQLFVSVHMPPTYVRFGVTQPGLGVPVGLLMNIGPNQAP